MAMWSKYVICKDQDGYGEYGSEVSHMRTGT